MFKSSQKYYNLQDFKIDVNFNRNINIVFRKKFLENDKINIDTFIKNIKEKFETRTCFINNCLFFSFKIANNNWEKVIINPANINLKVNLLRISIFDTDTKKYLFTKVFNIPNSFSERIIKEIKKYDCDNFIENKKSILKMYSPDILTELSFNRFFYFKEEKKIENFNTNSKIKLLKFDNEKITLKKLLKNYIHKEIENKEKIYEEFCVFATFGYGGFDNLTPIYENNKLVLKNKEYIDCKVKKVYKIENHFLKISDVIIEDYYYYVPEGAIIFLELPEKYNILVKKQKKISKLY